MWLHLDLITRVVGITADIFPTVDYAYTSIPTYPSGDWIIQIRLAANPCLTMTTVMENIYCAGQIGLLVCGRGRESVKAPVREMSPGHRDLLRFYNPALHTASFVLPTFARKAIDAPKQNKAM